MKYRAVYEREPDGRWTVEIPDVPGCHTYGRTIDQARERLREALSLFRDAPQSAEFEDVVRLPRTVMQRIRAAKELRETVEQEETKMVTAQVDAVRALRKMKLGHRDAGTLLGLSHQRVQQLEQRKPRASARPSWVPGAVIEAEAMRARHLVKRAAKKR